MTSIHFEAGPALTMKVSVEEGRIQSISLAPATEPGLECQFYGGECDALVDWLKGYCDKKEPATALPLTFDTLPPFTEKVLRALSGVSYGQSLTYQKLAEKVGNPSAARAVGNACGRNPFPLVIPCHRVLAAGHRLGGFSLDLEVKRRLLAFEGTVLA